MSAGRPPADPARLDFAGIAAALLHWSERRPDAAAVILLADGEGESARLTYGALASEARRLAGAFVALGLAGRPLLLPAQTSVEFVTSLYAALLSGVVAVPVSTQSRGPAADRLRAVAGSCGAADVLDAPGVDSLLEVLPEARRVDFQARGPNGVPVPPTDGARVALLQYTSGSTSVPRGVAISADNLARNGEMARRAYRVRPGSRMLSWLPLFHDMGLMSLVMPLWAGITTVLMPPLAFLHRPQRWPIAIDRHRATMSGGPNFAFDLCAARAGAALAAGIDLSGWDLAFCGSEPVRRSTLQRFADAYRPAAFDPTALYPCYGLAEATVYVSGGHWDPSATGETVSCGPPADGSTIRVVGPGGEDLTGDGGTGELWLGGPQVGLGYWNDPAATAETFEARLPGSPGRYLRTGDIGRLERGEVHVLGRLKDVLIHRGTNIHAADLEESVTRSHPAFAEAPGAAFAVEHADREAVVLVQEVGRRFTRPESLRPLVTAAEDAVALDHGLRLHDLLIVRPGTLPRTASGKVRRNETRRLYLAGEFQPRRVAVASAALPELQGS